MAANVLRHGLARSAGAVAEWATAVDEFLAPWKRKREVLGAVVAGSRVVGTHTPNSDIDIHIVLSDRVSWRERGNRRVAGFLIEYFANPLRQLTAYRENDRKRFVRSEARMFSQGELWFDKTGAVARLQRIGRSEMTRPFRRLTAVEIELAKYALWDELDNLVDLARAESPLHGHAYHHLLDSVLDAYRRLLGCEVSHLSKLWRFFCEPEFRRRQAYPEFPDQAFARLFLACVRTMRQSAIERLVEHVHERMGGFHVDGWKLRTPAIPKVARRGKVH